MARMARMVMSARMASGIFVMVAVAMRPRPRR
jgi:hypothetical protein